MWIQTHQTGQQQLQTLITTQPDSTVHLNSNLGTNLMPILPSNPHNSG